MCAIVGALVWNLKDEKTVESVNNLIAHIVQKSHERGRDGRGYMVRMDLDDPILMKNVRRMESASIYNHSIFQQCAQGVFLANLRAEPTTEYVENKRKEDQQPYRLSPWTIVHNGTIANDKKLRTYAVDTKIDSAAIVEKLQADGATGLNSFYEAVLDLEGSYAILAYNEETPRSLYVAANYRPIWYIGTDHGIFFASSRFYFPEGTAPQMLKPYTLAEFSIGTERTFYMQSYDLRPLSSNTKRALVVCSGGMDSVVAATVIKNKGYDTTLMHFTYGSRAQSPEVSAVIDVSKKLDIPLIIRDMSIYAVKDSPLLDFKSHIAGGEKGAEFAYEWVPARNLVMLSLATAYAEANQFEVIVLGNNLEEAGAYPDNEPEFIHKFNDLLPFAIGSGKKLEVVMPVGNLMKHEIVALGVMENAPLDLTWSCYKSKVRHCGTCGPCFMRKKAFEINGFVDPIEYEE